MIVDFEPLLILTSDSQIRYLRVRNSQVQSPKKSDQTDVNRPHQTDVNRPPLLNVFP